MDEVGFRIRRHYIALEWRPVSVGVVGIILLRSLLGNSHVERLHVVERNHSKSSRNERSTYNHLSDEHITHLRQ